jgi:Co/Zn/Cd efflux system component
MYAQGVPETVERVALNKCLRDAMAIDGVLDCHAPRFWALHPGALVGTLTVRVVAAADEQKVLREVHAVFESALGCSNLTVQVEKDSA